MTDYMEKRKVRDYRLFWWALKMAILIVGGVVFISVAWYGHCERARADSTWVAVEKPKAKTPAVLHESCRICGHCIPYPVHSGWQYTLGVVIDTAKSAYRYSIERPPQLQKVTDQFACSTCDDTARSSPRCWFIIERFDNQTIKWGYWREICRVDTCWYDSLLYESGKLSQCIRSGDVLVSDRNGRLYWHIDTIYTDDPRCGKPRVDSAQIKPPDR